MSTTKVRYIFQGKLKYPLIHISTLEKQSRYVYVYNRFILLYT